MPPAEIGSSFDSVLRLFDSAGNQLAADDDTDGPDSYIEYRLPTDGTYYVGVSGHDNLGYDPNLAGSGVGGSTGEYTLKLALTSIAPTSGQVRGTTWDDRNGNGVRDGGEGGLAGWTAVTCPLE